jgi:hypothetical protein
MNYSEPEATRHAVSYLKRRIAIFNLKEKVEKKYFESIEIDVPPSFMEVVKSGAVYAVSHMLDPYLAVALVGKKCVAVNGPPLILRKPLSEDEEKIFKCFEGWTGGEGEYRDPMESSSIKGAIKLLRNGGNVLSFFDMPAQFGRPVEVSFFARRAWFAAGLVSLAYMGRVPIVMCSLQRSSDKKEDKNKLRLVTYCIDPAKPTASQELISCLEREIRSDPSGWDFLLSMRSYFYLPNTTAFT